VSRLLDNWQPDPDARPATFLESSPDDPVATCPELPEHLAWVRRMERVEREVHRLGRRIHSGGAELVGRFRSIQRLLDEWGYIDRWTLTADGERLRFVYNELDLLLAESVRRGAFEALLPADLAAVTSFFTFQPRAADAEHGFPTGATAAASSRIDQVWEDLHRDEQRFGIPETRPIETGFAALAHGWASGHDLEDLFDDEVAAGDFVRNCRQLLDLLRQLRDAFDELRESATGAISSVDRGIVAAGGRL
jgi:ATP-dependent RNA helicase HelY